MKAAKYNLYLEAGSTFYRRIRLRDHDIMPIDMWDYILEGNIKTAAGGTLLMEISERNTLMWVNRISEAQILANYQNRPALWSLLDTYVDISLSSLNTATLLGNDVGEFQVELIPIDRTISIPISGGYAYATIDVSDPVLGLRGTITASGGTPFSGLVGDDVIHVYNTQTGNDGVYKVYTVTATVITTHSTIRGTDSVGSSETSIVIDKLVGTDAAHVRYMKGRVRIDHETVT